MRRQIASGCANGGGSCPEPHVRPRGSRQRRATAPRTAEQDIENCLELVPPNKDCTGTRAAKRACRKNLAAQRKNCHSVTKLSASSRTPA